MKFQKILRYTGLILMIILALSGIGIVPPARTKDFENEIKIELVEEKKEDDITMLDAEKEVQS
ncbi:MAG: hypothetical protein JNM57_15570 [Cyclobacteriaceae bacterium]|nr:hypothetical protein [Cyclobacteriaceae bacterium]